MAGRAGVWLCLLALCVGVCHGQNAIDSCTGPSEYSVSYCSDFVNYDLSEGAVADIAGAEERAFAAYRELLAQWNNGTGTISAACLSFEPRWQCVSELPSCKDGLSQPICRHFCVERQRRCGYDDSVCDELPDDDCAEASALRSAGMFAVVTVCMLVMLQDLGWLV